jgi:hypothetical protein
MKGWRHVKCTDRHTAVDYAQVLKELSNLHFPNAMKIVLVQYNLNTHKPASMPIEISPKVPAENSPLRYASIVSKATRRLDFSENVKIELEDGLESLGGGAVTEAVGQGVAPGGVFGLKGEQFGDGVVPSLRAWSPSGWRPRSQTDSHVSPQLLHLLTLVVAYSGANGGARRYYCRVGHLNHSGDRCLSAGGMRIDRAGGAEVIRHL